jgi:hypothetical protein
VVVSKRPFDLQGIFSRLQHQGTGADFYHTVLQALPNRLSDNAAVQCNNDRLDFDAATDGQQVLVFFIRMKHI